MKCKLRHTERPSRHEHALGLLEQSDFSESKRLPTGREILSVMLYRVKRVKDSVPASAAHVIKTAYDIYRRRNIPTKDKSNAVRDLIKFYRQWEKLKKFKRATGPHVAKIASFQASLGNYYPLHHHNWRNILRNKEDRIFLEQQICNQVRNSFFILQ